MRVLTLNVWCRHGSWPERRKVLIDGLRALRPDLVAFQEVVLTDGYDQVRDLLGAEYHVAHQAGRAPDGSGAAIASRWPLATVHQLDLHLTERTRRDPGWIGSVAIAEVLAPEPFGGLLFVNHKPSWELGFERERELQAVAAARFIDEALDGRDLPVVLAGDMDATPDAASIRFWRGLQSLKGSSVTYWDAWETAHPGDPGHTVTPRNPLMRDGEMRLERGRRIDHVFVRSAEHGPPLRVVSCELAFAEPVDGVWASDHFGVVADLAVPGEERS
jgi:endonuclease/exonuclease/phosphatase family metal-dependent hydrolase